MKITFQADADLDGRVIRGLKRAFPEIDIRTATEAGLSGMQDPKVLQLAAEIGRVLVSQDRRTMPFHFIQYIRNASSPGVILLREATPIAVAIEGLALIWSASEASEWTDRLGWIPL
jgi:predicted nuclease of predicted toxin-antitoxin system